MAHTYTLETRKSVAETVAILDDLPSQQQYFGAFWKLSASVDAPSFQLDLRYGIPGTLVVKATGDIRDGEQGAVVHMETVFTNPISDRSPVSWLVELAIWLALITLLTLGLPLFGPMHLCWLGVGTGVFMLFKGLSIFNNSHASNMLLNAVRSGLDADDRQITPPE